MKIENIKKNDMVVSINDFDIYNRVEFKNAIDTLTDTLSAIVPQIFAEIRSNIKHKEWRILHNKGYNYFEEMTCDDLLYDKLCGRDDKEVTNLINSRVINYISNSRNLFVRINGNDYRVIQILRFDKLPLWHIWDCVFNEDEERAEGLECDVWLSMCDLRDDGKI